MIFICVLSSLHASTELILSKDLESMENERAFMIDNIYFDCPSFSPDFVILLKICIPVGRYAFQISGKKKFFLGFNQKKLISLCPNFKKSHNI